MLNNAMLEKNYDFFMLIETLQRNGVQCESIDNSDVIKASYQGHDELLVDHVFPYMPLGYANILSDKFYFKQLLTDKNFPVLKGDVFHKSLFDEALAYVNKNDLWPVTVKPPDLSCGDNVFCAIQCEEDFKKIWLNIIQPGESLCYLIEPAWPFCPDYRFAWFCDREPSVLRRTVPEVIGDGKKTIAELVACENQRRETPPRTSLCDIFLSDQDGERCLANQKKSLTTVPQKNEVVKLRYISNLSYGGMSETVENSIVHPSYWDLLKKLASLFPALPFLTVDILINDISQPVSFQNTAICESQSNPSVSSFLNPGKGKSIDLYQPIVEILFPELKKGSNHG